MEGKRVYLLIMGSLACLLPSTREFISDVEKDI